MANDTDMQNLFRKYLNNECSREEVHALLEHFEADANEATLKDLITSSLETGEAAEIVHSGSIEKVLAGIKTIIAAEKTKSIPLYRKTWFRVAAAAVLLLGMIGFYQVFNKKEVQSQEVVTTNGIKADIKPGGNRAILTLANGSTIILDSAANGALSQQGGTSITKQDGQLAYNTTNGKPAEILFNMVTTPRGGQYQLVLSDGSKVWLNAASSLRFPTAFTSKERVVEITGEAYFEISHDATKPFKVTIAGKGQVEVLGTHFNINAYAEESSINTTLLEGSVIISDIATRNTARLQPGQQARLTPAGQISLGNNTDIEEVMAWKNGKFQFSESADITTIMRQLSRWYDIDIVYKGTITGHIGGTISRDVNASKVFEMMEMTGTIRFEVSGRQVTVMPKTK
ncbi:MAG: FecR domain-containing protein [Bacteroidota bacterium]